MSVAPAADGTIPVPYRVLFPVGVAFAVAGAVPWILAAAGIGTYPGPLHRSLMIQGFELSFVLGFLLTALPGFLHAPKCSRWELAVALVAQLVFGAAALAGAVAAAQVASLASLALIGVAAGRRAAHARAAPPVEMVFIPFALLCGITGAVLTLGATVGWIREPVPGFASRLLSLGMVLSLVLGVGGLLVPVFAGIRDPLVIPGIAAPHARRGRFLLYAGVVVSLAVAFALEATGWARAGMALRAAAASVMVLLVWKVWKRSAFPVPRGWVLRGAGWFMVLGLWAAVAWPPYQIAALHLTLIGGFGLLTLGIGSRVVVAHGGHGLAAEKKLLTPLILGAVALAMTLRIGADLTAAFPAGVVEPARAASFLLATAAALWVLAWLGWGGAALGLRGAPADS